MAEQWLIEDLADAEKEVNRLGEGYLTQHQFDALVDFVFNVGAGNFRTSTLFRKLQARDFVGASMEFKRWVRASGKVLKGLVIRRQAEEDWFIKGE
jgi:lysozyme